MTRTFRLAATLILFLFAVPSVFAEDAGDVMSLQEIDSLIKDTNYDLALVQLHQFIVKYPERFDSAQQRVRKIMDARNRYTVLANRLIDVIQTDPGNDEKVLGIIAQLEALERHPSDKQLAFIREAKIAAQFSYYRSQFTLLQKQSADMAHAGDYTGGADKARSGFYMYQSDFFDEYTSSAVVTPVRSALAQADADLASYKTVQESVNAAVNAFVRTVRTGDAKQAEIQFNAVRASFAEYARIRNSMCASGWQLQSVFDSIRKKNPDLTDASFLPFVSRFILGSGSVADSGIVGVMDCEWDALENRMKNELYTEMQAKFEPFRLAAAEGMFAGKGPSRLPASALESLENFSGLGNEVSGLYAMLKTQDGGTLEKKYPYYPVSADYAAGISRQIRALIAAAGKIDEERVRALKTAVPDNPGGAELAGGTYASGMIASADFIEKTTGDDAETVLSASQWAVPYRHAETVPAADKVLSWTDMEDSYRTLNAELASFSQNTAADFWKRAASYYASAGVNYTDSCRTSVAETQTLYKGRTDDKTGLTAKYPQEALDSVLALRKTIAADRAVLVKAKGVLAAGKYHESYADSKASVDASIAMLDSFDPVLAEIENGSREQIRLARRAQNEADLRLSQARSALASQDFDQARKRLQDARSKYNEALSYQESSPLRTKTDTELASLGSEISEKQNEKVVRDVRTLKTRAKNEYYNGNFDTAENLLTQAKAMWAVTNVDDDEEIQNLLALVSTALSMKTGRVIPPSAPLYPEMSQILSIAQQYFRQGSSLLKKGKKEEGKDVLRQALQKLQELQLVYPLNQEASLLTLRIQKILDPDGFNDLFAKRVQTAKETYRVAGKQQSAYTDLLDLYEINPSYPGLRQLIYDVEIEIGVRQKPVDRSSLVKSKQLTAEAQKIVSAAGRDEIKLRQALSRVDEAIRLNPDNDEAMLLKDRIQTSIGGKAAVVLSSEDEAKYQLAVQNLQNNDIVTANALVEQLLQKNVNRRSSKILDLQKKIKALL